MFCLYKRFKYIKYISKIIWVQFRKFFKRCLGLLQNKTKMHLASVMFPCRHKRKYQSFYLFITFYFPPPLLRDK